MQGVPQTLYQSVHAHVQTVAQEIQRGKEDRILVKHKALVIKVTDDNGFAILDVEVPLFLNPNHPAPESFNVGAFRIRAELIDREYGKWLKAAE